MLPFHIEILILLAGTAMLWGIKTCLSRHYGENRKKRYITAWCKFLFGSLLLYMWLGLKGDWLVYGVSGMIMFAHALGQLAKFAPRKSAAEKEHATFR